MLSVSQYSLALLLVAAAASNGLTEAGLPTGDYHTAMLTAVNQERAKQGVASLCINKKLQAAAQRHSDDMAKNNYMAHDGADGSTMSQRITEAGYEWDSVAENVAAGQEEVQSVMESWMTSAGHRENIMSPDYTMFGAAFSYNKDSQYGIYWTQDFGSGGSEACDGGNTTVSVTPAPTKQEIVTPAPTTSVPEIVTPVPTTSVPEIPATPATKAPVVTPAATTPAPVVTPAATTPAPVVTPAATTPGPVATPATTTPAPVATPVSTTPAPVATPVSTTPAPVATPAATTPSPVATPAATTTPPSASQNDCESNF